LTVVPNFLIQIISLSAVTVVLCKADILENLKEYILQILFKENEDKKEKYGALLYCPMCLGFWVGLSGSNFFNINYLTNSYILNMVLVGFMISYFSSLLGKFVE